MCRICDGEGCLNCERDPYNVEEIIKQETENQDEEK